MWRERTSSLLAKRRWSTRRRLFASELGIEARSLRTDGSCRKRNHIEAETVPASHSYQDRMLRTDAPVQVYLIQRGATTGTTSGANGYPSTSWASNREPSGVLHNATVESSSDELIYFPDNQGYIGPRVSKKLARDFERGAEGLRTKDWRRSLYYYFRRAFELAANDGVVIFH